MIRVKRACCVAWLRVFLHGWRISSCICTHRLCWFFGNVCEKGGIIVRSLIWRRSGVAQVRKKAKLKTASYSTAMMATSTFGRRRADTEATVVYC